MILIDYVVSLLPSWWGTDDAEIKVRLVDAPGYQRLHVFKLPEVGQNIALDASLADKTSTHLGCNLISAFLVHSTSLFCKLFRS